MPAKKSKNKVKKAAPKKPVKAAKKPVKKVVKKAPAKKTMPKKPVKKALPKKVTKKSAPKKLKKETKKAAPKKTETKKVLKKLPEKKTAKKPEPKAPKKEEKTSLAKTILGKNKDKKAAEAKNEKPEAPKKITFSRRGDVEKVSFKVGDFAVYPSHGIGKIVEIEESKILGKDFKCYLMYFEKEKLTIKIPVNSAERIGLRHLISKAQMDEVFSILRSGVKKLKGMWSRRAQEYETKINSGDIMLLAEVLRDLTRDIEDGDRSYSERIIYETAINRLASEYSAIYGSDFEEAKQKVILTAKDKLNSEGKIIQKDEFDDFDLEDKDPDSEDEDEENEDEEDEEDEDDDFDYDDDDDDEKPRKKRKK
jgi:CarD family transcriptional regulator